MRLASSSYAIKAVVCLGTVLLLQLASQQLIAMWYKLRAALALGLAVVPMPSALAHDADLSWHAPRQSLINNLTNVLSDSGVYGFIYDSSETSEADYGTYNWCSMPHVRKTEYVKPSCDYELIYVELVRPSPSGLSGDDLLKPISDATPSQAHTVFLQRIPCRVV